MFDRISRVTMTHQTEELIIHKIGNYFSITLYICSIWDLLFFSLYLSISRTHTHTDVRTHTHTCQKYSDTKIQTYSVGEVIYWIDREIDREKETGRDKKERDHTFIFMSLSTFPISNEQR